MEYPLMSPPFELLDFSEMKDKDAKVHLNWYIGQIPIRIELLSKAYKKIGGGEAEDLDFSKNSLVKLWSWYINNAEIASKSSQELEKEYASANVMTKTNINTIKVKVGWMAIANDISIYFAQCMINNNSQLEWGYVSKPKSLSYVNKPIIKGFKNNIEMDATNLIFVQTRKILKGVKDENALEKLFENWQNKI